jgi:hypothetical protein
MWKGVVAVAVLGVASGCSGGDGGRPSPKAAGSATAVAPSPSASAPVGETSPRQLSPVPTASPSPTAVAVAYPARCHASALRLGAGERVSEATGQHTISLTLTNVSSSGCHMVGYPGLSYLDASGRMLPFRSVWGGDQMVTSNPPVRVDLAPGGVAYILANKYRCDRGDVAQATTVHIIPPDERVPLSLSLADMVSIAYCGAGDPGSSVFVSPVEPSYIATIASH